MDSYEASEQKSIHEEGYIYEGLLLMLCKKLGLYGHNFKSF